MKTFQDIGGGTNIIPIFNEEHHNVKLITVITRDKHQFSRKKCHPDQ